MLFCSHRSQLFDERNIQKSSNSAFVFGENMVDRVLVRSVNASRLIIKVNVPLVLIFFQRLVLFSSSCSFKGESKYDTNDR